MPDTRPLRFFHRGAIVEVSDAPPTRTVLQWLREDRRLTGTKEGCAEGDCGACTVVIGELDAAGGLALKPVNACIRFLPTLDGKALFTVEDLAGPGGTLHPVQQALVQHHGSQCGFCTPGFVMSLWAGHERHGAAGRCPSRQQLADELSGNLCRCTGYRPILDAAQALHAEGGPPRLDRAPVIAALQALRADAPLAYAAPGGRFDAPRSADALAALLAARPQARLLAGGTDMGLWVTKQLRDLPDLVHTAEVAELQRLERSEAGLHIGAAVSLQAAWAAMAAEWPELREHALRFASLPVREAGTLGGNVANGSPIGDAAPVLIALGAQLRLRRGAQARRLPLEDFYLGYMKNALQPGEFLQAIEVPPRAAGRVLCVDKISKRFDCDISAVCAAFAFTLEAGRVQAPRLAFGGMAATVRRAAGAEAALAGRAWDAAAVQAAREALAADFTPLTDLRASAAYRLQVSQNLLTRWWLQTRAEAPLPAAALSVWAREGAA